MKTENQPHNKLLIKNENIQGVTSNGSRVFGLAYLKLQFRSLYIEHSAVVVNKITDKLILENDFFVQYQCDILNSDCVIVFGKTSVPYKLLCATINLICPSSAKRALKLSRIRRQFSKDCSTLTGTTIQIKPCYLSRATQSSCSR